MAKVQPWCTGVVHLYAGLVGSPTSPSPVYLGTGEQGPEPEDDHRFTAIMNDLAGPEVPFDYQYAGFLSRASFVLTRWNEVAIQLLEAQPSPLLGSVPGVNSTADMGTIMGLEGGAIQFWLRNTMPALKAAHQQLGNGRRYPQCILASPIKRIQGNRPNKIVFGILSWGQYSATLKKFTHWDDQGVAALPAPE